MPELPEVETVVRELRPRLVNRRIRAIQVSQQGSFVFVVKAGANPPEGKVAKVTVPNSV